MPPEPAAVAGCRACGWSNDPDRELCFGCGRDLETGEALPTLTTSRAYRRVTLAHGPRRRRRRGWAVLVAAVLVVVVAVTGGLWAAGIGPFAPGVELPPAAFDPARVDGEPAGLDVTGVATLTVAPDAGGATAPLHLVDADPTTAWRADTGSRPADLPAEVPETIDLVLDEPAWLTAVTLANGDQSDAASFPTAGRATRLRLIADGDEVREVVVLDQPGRQRIELDRPLLTTGLRIQVLASEPGSVHTDPALSELTLTGHRADPAHAELAARRAALAPATGPLLLPGDDPELRWPGLTDLTGLADVRP